MIYFERLLNELQSNTHNDWDGFPPAKTWKQLELKTKDFSAIGRVIYAYEVFVSDKLDVMAIHKNNSNNNETMKISKVFTDTECEKWYEIRSDMTEQTAKNIIILLMKNDRFIKDKKVRDRNRRAFFNVMFDFTKHSDLSNSFTKLFFEKGVRKT